MSKQVVCLLIKKVLRYPIALAEWLEAEAPAPAAW